MQRSEKNEDLQTFSVLFPFVLYRIRKLLFSRRSFSDGICRQRNGCLYLFARCTNLDDNAIISGNELAPAEIKFYGKGKFYFSQPLSHREGNEVAFPEFTISGNFYNAEGNRAYENSLMYYNESYSPKILEFGRCTEGSGENKVTYNHSYEITSANVYWAREVSDFGFDIKNPFEMFRWEMKTGYLYVVFHGKYTRTNSTDTKRYPNLVGKSMIIHMCYNVQDIEDSTLGLGAFFHPGKLIHQEVDTNAEEMPETVSYSSFSADIVEGTKTAAAAVAVAVAAGAAVSAMQKKSAANTKWQYIRISVTRFIRIRKNRFLQRFWLRMKTVQNTADSLHRISGLWKEAMPSLLFRQACLMNHGTAQP